MARPIPDLDPITAAETADNDHFVLDDTSEQQTKRLPKSEAMRLFVPSGMVMPYAGAVAPDGFLMCYGQLISRATYAALFTAIGTLYGSGDGSTTFAVPDLRGRVIAGQDDMGGTSANRLTGLTGGVDGDVLGASGGAESHTLSLAQIPNVTGNASLHGGEGGSLIGGVSGAFTTPEYIGQYRAAGGITGGASSIRYSMGFNLGGGGGAHNNVQPTTIMNYLIKT